MLDRIFLGKRLPKYTDETYYPTKTVQKKTVYDGPSYSKAYGNTSRSDDKCLNVILADLVVLDKDIGLRWLRGMCDEYRFAVYYGCVCNGIRRDEQNENDKKDESNKKNDKTGDGNHGFPKNDNSTKNDSSSKNNNSIKIDDFIKTDIQDSNPKKNSRTSLVSPTLVERAWDIEVMNLILSTCRGRIEGKERDVFMIYKGLLEEYYRTKGDEANGESGANNKKEVENTEKIINTSKDRSINNTTNDHTNTLKDNITDNTTSSFTSLPPLLHTPLILLIIKILSLPHADPHKAFLILSDIVLKKRLMFYGKCKWVSLEEYEKFVRRLVNDNCDNDDNQLGQTECLFTFLDVLIVKNLIASSLCNMIARENMDMLRYVRYHLLEKEIKRRERSKRDNYESEINENTGVMDDNRILRSNQSFQNKTDKYFDFLVVENQMIMAQVHMKETFLEEIKELKKENERLRNENERMKREKVKE